VLAHRPGPPKGLALVRPATNPPHPRSVINYNGARLDWPYDNSSLTGQAA